MNQSIKMLSRTARTLIFGQSKNKRSRQWGGAFILLWSFVVLQIFFSASNTAISAAEPEKSDNQLQRFETTEIKMAMPVRVVLYAKSADQAKQGFKIVFDRFTTVNAIMSDYQPDSELMKLSAGAPHVKNSDQKNRSQTVSDDLFTVLQFGQELSKNSDGAFDMTIGPLTSLWRKTKRNRELPPPEVLEAARKLVDYKNVILNEKEKSVTLARSGMRLDAGGIAVGYTVDMALAELKKNGITRAMIDASGDIGCSDAPPNQTGWRIGIAPLNPTAPPSRFLRIANAAITTSGDSYQHVTIAGQRYSHIVDPKTGVGLHRPVAATVYARDCISADALATTVCILGPERGMELLKKYPGSEMVMLLAKDLKEKPAGIPSKKENIESNDVSSVDLFVSPGLEKLEEKPTLAK
jgi:thiamine biosynthesis lipoprotein